MTFQQFYQEVIKKSGVNAEQKYVRILWDNAYTIEQAIHNLQTMNDE
jgi:hypothetical protein